MTCPQHVDDLLAEAFACFEQGLCYDEIDASEEAVGMYERGLTLVKEAEKEKNFKKSELYKTITESRKRVEKRLPRLKKRKSPRLRQKRSISEKEKSADEDDVEKLELRQELEAVGEGEAELVFSIPDGVQLFIIEGEETSVPTYPCPLQIFRFNAQTQTSAGVQAEAFIQVGPWIYPLIPGKTPVLKNDIGAYVVPNPTDEHPNDFDPKLAVNPSIPLVVLDQRPVLYLGDPAARNTEAWGVDNADMFVGIILPSDLDKEIEDDFFNYLKQFTELRTQDITRSLSTEERKRLSDKIANFLVKGGEKVAWGVNKTAHKASVVVAEHANKHRSTVRSNERPMVVNPAVRTSIHYVHKGSKVVAKCTRYLLDKIGDMGVAVGRQLASSAEKRFGDGKGGGLVSGTINVLGGGIVGASTVWMSMENASKTLCRNIANEAVDTVKVKYGDEASVTAHEALFATGHSTLAAFQIWDLGPRSVAGRAARKAGVEFVKDLHKKQSSSNAPSLNET